MSRLKSISAKRLASLGGVYPSSTLTRTGGPSRDKPMARVNRARKAVLWKRAYHSLERVLWLKAQPCVVCGDFGTGPCENAHVGNGGMARKASYKSIVPLCSPHHQGLHKRGRKSFEARYGISLAALAKATQERWEREQGER